MNKEHKIVEITWDDVPDDIKKLIEDGVYKKEDVLCEVIAISNE